MSKRWIRKRHGAAWLAIAVLTAVYWSDSWMIVRPEATVDRYARKIGESLARDHGLFSLVTFDERPPREWVAGAAVNQSGVESVPGVFGRARAFDGRHTSFVEVHRDWREAGSQFSISTRVWLDEASLNQDIVFSGGHRGLVGLALSNGRMTLHIPPWNQRIAYPFAAYGRFVHLVAVVDGEQGHARLYEDGRLMAEGAANAVLPPDHGVQMGKSRWDVVRNPLMGALDETAIWSRVLSEAEVHDLFRTRQSLLPSLRPEYYWRWQAMRRWRDALRALLKTIDHFNPRLHPGRIRLAAIPDVSLHLSKGDWRRLADAHRHSVETGRRVARAARPRPVKAVIDGKSREGELWLAGSRMDYAERSRMGFEVAFEHDDADAGPRRLRLMPPESFDALAPLVESRLAARYNASAVSNGLCRVYVNGRFLGVYYFEHADRMGIAAGAGESLFYGPESPADWKSRFHKRELAYRPRSSLLERWPVDEDDVEALFDRVADDIGSLLIHDTASPKSSREIRRGLRSQRRRRVAGFAAESGLGPARMLARTLNPFMILNGNPSPFYLVDDLDLDRLRYPGVSVSWSSSAPEILADNGRVTRPADGGPREARLTAVLDDGQERLDVPMRFRVMPRHTRVGAVMLYAAEQLNRVVRVDTEAHYYPPGTHVTTPRILTGLQGSRGGLKHRGGTSHWEPKKPFSLQTCEPHFWLDQTPTRHLYFVPAYLDATFMRNKLSYDLWTSLSEPDAPRYAPTVTWAEVFVNGVYHGLYEMGTRVQRRMLGLPPYRPDTGPYGQIHKTLDIRNSFSKRSYGSFIQKYPHRRWGTLSEPFMAFLDALDTLSPASALTDIDAVLDVDNAADFHLFLNLTEGRDAMHINFYLASFSDNPERFVFAVFDCDKTFLAGGTEWYRNFLIERLEGPAFHRHVINRWTRMRAGPASAETLLRQVDDMERRLADSMPWEYERWGWRRDERWGVCREKSFADHVDELRANIRSRQAFMDEHMALKAKAME